jgi:3-oxoacyl-[acyl-carrier protein] reductase
MNPDDSGEFASAARELIAVDHHGQPRDIASAVSYLAGPESGFVAGTTWNIDGGFVVEH